MTIAYTSTATIALILVVLHYIFVYHPDAAYAAAREGIKHEHPSKINPIDEYLLYWRMGAERETRGIEGWGEKGMRVRNALTYVRSLSSFPCQTNPGQAMLTMSDFQLITGLSILISGFTQLDTGISAYHWQRLVQLAWFSSITHLCTLTALRNYFRRHSIGYFWRLPGMIILVLMLIVALVPTGQYTWEAIIYENAIQQDIKLRPQPTDLAICYFHSHENTCPSGWFQRECDLAFEASLQRMALSAVFLAVGMCNRLWHLIRLPAQLFNSARSFCSHMSTKALSCMHDWAAAWPLWLSLPFAALLYYPSLAVFLTIRLVADMVTSRAFEVIRDVCAHSKYC